MHDSLRNRECSLNTFLQASIVIATLCCGMSRHCKELSRTPWTSEALASDQGSLKRFEVSVNPRHQGDASSGELRNHPERSFVAHHSCNMRGECVCMCASVCEWVYTSVCVRACVCVCVEGTPHCGTMTSINCCHPKWTHSTTNNTHNRHHYRH